ncbi:hypothetical protein [Pseudonocardia sp. ICBG601]|uniref:hypothetical protein n=1 Tax=Pseudonocardia sp. ICBG601 TaxID=2846759 RepID=UPI001CF628EF|nr:hypothetical protein [Pseudonocardia sp. ICBG601]
MNGSVLAQGLDASRLMEWLSGNAIPVIVIVIGLCVVAAAAKADLPKIISVVVCLLLGLVVVGIGLVDGGAKGVAEWAANLVTSR